MTDKITTDIAIIGAGTAGLYALREIKKSGKSYVVIDSGPLGTTCARVGCMPSKVALHAGHLWQIKDEFSHAGITGAENLSIDLTRAWEYLRSMRDMFSGSAKKKTETASGDNLLIGQAKFITPTELEVTTVSNTVQVVAEKIIIANGSRPVVPAWLESVKDKMVTTDELFELKELPQRIGVLGLGAIGLEMGLALSRLGLEVTGADLAPAVAGISDPVLMERSYEIFSQEMTIWLGEAVSVAPTENGVMLKSGERETEVDLLICALGRRPNTDQLNLEAAGFPLNSRGVPLFNPATMQIRELPVFMAGDIDGDRPLMHEAADEGMIAGYNAVNDLKVFPRKVPLGIAFTSPDVCSIGARWNELDAEQICIGQAGGDTNGRAKILGAQSSLIRIYAEKNTRKLLGASLVGEKGEHLSHLLAWAIQRGETVDTLLEMPFYHPVMEEMLQTALQSVARQCH